MLQWIKRYVAKRCRKLKQKKICKENVIEDVDSDNLNHTYEEIPDVIPANWRGVRSDSVPSFFLIATADHSFASYVDDDDFSTFLPKPSLLDQSYETPQNCLGHRFEDVSLRIDQTEFMLDNYYTVGNVQDLTELCDTIDTVQCGRDRLSCVRVSCHHHHSVANDTIPRREECKSDQHCEDDLPYYSILEPSWEKFCDDLVSNLLSKTSSFKQPLPDNKRNRDYGDIYFSSSKRNILLGDLIQRNYDRVY